MLRPARFDRRAPREPWGSERNRAARRTDEVNQLPAAAQFFFMSSFFMLSLDIASSFFMPSFDIVSFFMLSLDIVSFFIASSLPILSWAKAAGAAARLSEIAAAEIPSAIRVRIDMRYDPFENWLCKRLMPPPFSTWVRSSLLRRGLKNFCADGFLSCWLVFL